MKKSFYLFLCSFLIASCGDDTETTPGSLVDAPHSVIGADAIKYSQRKEVPAIKDADMFVVHYTDKYGVTYSLEWDKAQKVQRWSAYSVNTTNNVKGWVRNSWNGYVWKGRYYTGDPFQEDSVIPKAYRTVMVDYSNQRQYKYNRGHIVNSNDRLASANANGQTYYLSNIHPQLSAYNSGIWLNMENKLHNWEQALKAGEMIYIVKGGTTQVTASVPKPFIDDDAICLKVPRFFFMAILKHSSDNTWQAIAFWSEHKSNYDTVLKNYTISIDRLEELTGIDFFPNVDDNIENTVEKENNPSAWGVY